MTPRQAATWARSVTICTAIAVVLVVISLIVRVALLVLLPIAASLGLFAMTMGLYLRRRTGT